MSEIPCDCFGNEGDHPSRIICDACFSSTKGKAACCITTQEENKRLKDFAEWMLRHISDTCNAGFVIKNTDTRTIKLKAEQALRGK